MKKRKQNVVENSELLRDWLWMQFERHWSKELLDQLGLVLWYKHTNNVWTRLRRWIMYYEKT